MHAGDPVMVVNPRPYQADCHVHGVYLNDELADPASHNLQLVRDYLAAE